MTTLAEMSFVCAVCKLKTKYTVVGSTSTFGSADLDLRPPPLMRSTLPFGVQCCPRCGHCSRDVATLAPNAKQIVASAAYKVLLRDATLPLKTRHFSCYAMLCGADTRKAAHALLCSAWTCDDEKPAMAKQQREKTAAQLEKLQPLKDSEEGLTIGLILVDVYRRSGNFERAKALVEKLQTYRGAKGIFKDVLVYQQRLVAAQDTDVHLLSDARKTEPQKRP